MARELHPYTRLRENFGSALLEPKEHGSECVRSLEYDIDRQQLTVHFWKRGSYTYFDVPAWLFGEFNNASSRGTYFNLYFRDAGYSYDRIA
jgi:hypothetical protein